MRMAHPGPFETICVRATGARFLMRQFKRSQRLGMQIQRDISRILEQELAETLPGMVTLTYVKLSDDLRYARVYYSYLGSAENRERVDEHLTRERKRIRALVGQSLRIRHIPEIDFKYDPSVERGIRIEQLLEEIKKERSDR
jgi:ribosome-binding factor A